jgi:hypothetical protein
MFVGSCTGHADLLYILSSLAIRNITICRLTAWRNRWQKQEAKGKDQGFWDQIVKPPDPTILKLHKGLRNAESSILVQLRTGRTNFDTS